MKKGTIGTAIVLALGIGASGGYFIAKEELKKEVVPVKEEVKETTTIAQQQQQEQKEILKPPTKRTKDIGTNKPWQVYSTKELIDRRSEEQFFLFSDAESLENDVRAYYKNGGTTQEYYAIISVFVDQLKKYYPEKKAYFEKMQEAADTIMNKEFSKVPALIEEAKKLREAE
jgi:hypothetical protein